MVETAAREHASRDKVGRAAPAHSTPSPLPAPELLVGNQEMLWAVGARGALRVSDPSDPDEREAESAAHAVIAGRHVPDLRSASSSGVVHRACRSCEDEQATVHRKAAAPGPAPTRRGNLDRLAAAGRLQGIGRISEPGDASEHDANHVADRVASGPPISAVTGGKRAAPVSRTPAALFGASNGRPLDGTTRDYFEQRFGAPFNDVRVHTDEQTAASASALNANAFTTGSDIGFNSGQFSPQTSSGRSLLAHELAHVVQQRRSAVSGRGNADVLALQQRPDSKAENKSGGTDTPAQPGASTPSGATYTLEGLELSDNPEQVRSLLTAEVVAKGFSSVSGLPSRINLFLATTVAQAKRDKKAVEGGDKLSGGVPWTDKELARADDLRDKILPVVTQEVDALERKRTDFVQQFEDEGRAEARSALAESRKHVQAEAIRYGVANPRLAIGFGLYVTGDVADNASTRGLALAAQGLLDRKDKADAAMSRYRDFTHGAPAIAELASQRLHSQEAEIAQYRADISRTQRDLDVYRFQVQMKFPLLAALSNPDDFKRSELQDVAKGASGKNSDAATVIVQQVAEKLLNISKVEKELKPGGDVSIWRVPKIVASVRSSLNVTPGSLNARIVDDKVREEQPSALTGILIGILQLGLVLLAPFTEGLTLIPAAMIGVGTAYQHFKEFETQSALHGTDFGAAALSAEEPSLFWLAVDIIGAGFDVGAAGGAALRLFRELAPVARAIRGGEVAEDAVRTIEKRAGELGGETLAKRVGDDARAIQRGASKEAGITAEEARKFEQAAADVATKELREGAQTAETLAGGKVTVGRSGGIWSCSSPCTMVRERFKDLLVREPKWAKRLDELENRARALATGPEGDLARKQIAGEAAALEREMRTTALPGDWTSPLNGRADFNDLVKERGSIAAELDTHPPGWSGKKEAEFRYGKAADAEPGYHWTIDEHGTPRYDRLDASKPRMRFNAASGAFEEAAEEGLVRARKGVEETRELAKLPKQEQDAMKAAFKKRMDFIAERDRLEALQEAGTIKPDEAASLKKLYAQINEQSRQLGEHAAEGVMSGKGGNRIYPVGKTYSTSGDFDQVWKVGDEFQIVEAKGGSSALGSRSVGQGMRAEQGTIEYAKSIAQNMAKNGATKEIRKLGRDLLDAIGQGKVKYILVRAPVGTEVGAPVLRDVKVSEFILK